MVSPAEIKGSRGVPNVLVIRGDYSAQQAEAALLTCWRKVLSECRIWIERTVRSQPEANRIHFDWDHSWRACELHSWELFHGQGETIHQARKAMAIREQQGNWLIPNWTGESSSLSCAEAVVRPLMAAVKDPRDLPERQIRNEARAFLQLLCRSESLGPAFADANEQISLTELIKRLVTYRDIGRRALSSSDQPLSNAQLNSILPERFQTLTNQANGDEPPESIVWFMADGDSIGRHIEALSEQCGSEEQALIHFSRSMRDWAAGVYQNAPIRLAENLCRSLDQDKRGEASAPADLPDQVTVVFAGGDDVLGALHESRPGSNDLSTDHLWAWIRTYPRLWAEASQPDPSLPPKFSVSMGLVWADSQVPQREALQQAREAQASAKARGKNRFALRLVQANGNHLEWTCPWSWLDPILNHYTDREGRSLGACRDDKPPNWRHLAEDLQWLSSRQAIVHLPDDPAARRATEGPCLAAARSLWDAYFPGLAATLEAPVTPAQPAAVGEAADHDGQPFTPSLAMPEQGRRFDQWLWDLGRVLAGLEPYRPALRQGVGP